LIFPDEKDSYCKQPWLPRHGHTDTTMTSLTKPDVPKEEVNTRDNNLSYDVFERPGALGKTNPDDLNPRRKPGRENTYPNDWGGGRESMDSSSGRGGARGVASDNKARDNVLATCLIAWTVLQALPS